MIHKFVIEVDLDVELHGLDNQDAAQYFFDDVLSPDVLYLHSNEIGDDVGKVKSIHLQRSEPNSYLLFWDEARHQEILAVATKYDDEKKPCLWAVRRGNSCMRKSDGAFIYEPLPSSRDDEFFAEYRFASFEEAERIYLSFHCR